MFITFMAGFTLLITSIANCIFLSLLERHLCCDGGQYYTYLWILAIILIVMSIMVICIGLFKLNKHKTEKGGKDDNI